MIGNLIRFQVYSLIKGFWSLWEAVQLALDAVSEAGASLNRKAYGSIVLCVFGLATCS